MEFKPWPLLILAFIYFIEPFTKVIFYSFYWQLSPIDFVAIELKASSLIQAFEFFLLFPIAGYALFAVKKWSFPVFIVVQIWVVSVNIPYLNELHSTQHILLMSFFVIFGILNIVVVGYLLIPAVRIAYLDPRIRWWEAKARYSKTIDGLLNGEQKATIKNVSESGVFITTEGDLPINSEVDLDFRFSLVLKAPREFHLQTRTHIVHHFELEGEEGYGARFMDLSTHERSEIKSLIKHLEKSNCQRRPPRRTFSDLLRWFKNLVLTGEGLIPKKNYKTV